MPWRVDRDAVTYVYFAEDEVTGFIKIGHSSQVRRRLRSLSNAIGGHPIRLWAFARGDEKTERRVQALFLEDRVHGEWFRRSPALDALMDFIKEFPSTHADLPSLILGRAS